MRDTTPTALVVVALATLPGSCVVATEGIGCVPGTIVICSYSGPSETAGVGACREGTSVCREDGTFGKCMGEVLPTSEDCATMVDDDCDGVANEGGSGSINCICDPGTLSECYSGPPSAVSIGRCAAGVQICDLQGTFGYASATADTLREHLPEEQAKYGPRVPEQILCLERKLFIAWNSSSAQYEGFQLDAGPTQQLINEVLSAGNVTNLQPYLPALTPTTKLFAV